MHRSAIIQDLMDSSGVRFGTSGIRGLVSELTDELCFAYVSAFLQTLGLSSGNVALAVDLRPSSPTIAGACVAAIRHAGLDVEYCGAIPTPALAHYAATLGRPAIMVSGSHIPFERNGLKFYGREGEISKSDEEAIAASIVTIPKGAKGVALPTVDPAAESCYRARYRNFFGEGLLAGMRVAVYQHSSVARDLLPEMLAEFGAEVIALGRSDGFVPIDTEAVGEDDVRRAREWASVHHFDAIVSTDGDADRPLVGDENGVWLRGDVTGLLCAKYLGAQAVATTVSCTTALERCGVFPKLRRTRIGSPYVIAAIEALLAGGAERVVGFEPNGGFLVGSAFGKSGQRLDALPTRDAMLPILSLLAMARTQGVHLSALPAGLPARFTASDRICDVPIESSQLFTRELATSPAALGEFLAEFSTVPVGIDQTDGLRIALASDEIVHLRPSGNAPELRCYAEAGSVERAGYLVRAALGCARQRVAERAGGRLSTEH